MTPSIISKLENRPWYGLAVGLLIVALCAWATPSRGQPALVNHAAYGVDGPTGFDQAQGR